MQFLRKLGLVLCAGVLVLALVGFGLALALRQTIGTPDTVKAALNDSNIYEWALERTLDEQADRISADSQTKIPLDDPEIREAIIQTVPPELIQEQTEAALDSIYDWIQRRAETLEFAIDLDETRETIPAAIGNYARERAAGLPTCASSNLPDRNANPLEVSCLPPGITPEQISAEAEKLARQDDFLEHTRLTQNDLAPSEGGQTIEERLSGLRQSFGALNSTVSTTAALALATGVGVVIFSASRRAGFKKLTIILIVTGVASAALGLLSWLIIGQAESIAGSDPAAQK